MSIASLAPCHPLPSPAGQGGHLTGADRPGGATQISALLTALAGWHRVESAARAAKLRTLSVLSLAFAEAAERAEGDEEEAEKVLAAEDLMAAEAAAALCLSRRHALSMMAEADVLTSRLPLTLEALSQGRFERSHVRAMLKVTEGLSDAAAGTVERHLLPGGEPPGVALTPAQIYRTGAAVAAAVEPPDPRDEALEEEALRERSTDVRLAPGNGFDDSPGSPAGRAGLATVQATMPAPDAALVWATVDAAARRLRDDLRARRRLARAAGEEVPAVPTLGRLRAQALRDLVCLPAGDPRRPVAPRVELQVTMPVTMLAEMLGAGGSRPTGGIGPLALLDPGGPPGPLPVRHAAIVQSLCGSADVRIRRLFTRPEGGLALAESETHDPPASLDRHVRLRDGVCRAPGCTTKARGCDLDHVVPYRPGDVTHEGNLHALCRHHHRLKTLSSWRPVLDPITREVRWRSPSGRCYITRISDYAGVASGPDPAGTLAPSPGRPSRAGGADDQPPPF